MMFEAIDFFIQAIWEFLHGIWEVFKGFPKFSNSMLPPLSKEEKSILTKDTKREMSCQTLSKDEGGFFIQRKLLQVFPEGREKLGVGAAQEPLDVSHGNRWPRSFYLQPYMRHHNISMTRVMRVILDVGLNTHLSKIGLNPSPYL